MNVFDYAALHEQPYCVVVKYTTGLNMRQDQKFVKENLQRKKQPYFCLLCHYWGAAPHFCYRKGPCYHAPPASYVTAVLPSYTTLPIW